MMLNNGIEFSHYNESFKNDRQFLEIDEVSESDAGHYTCIAINDGGSSEKDLIYSILNAPEMMEKQNVVEAKEGNTTIFICPLVEDNAEIEWFKNGVPVKTIPGSNFQITNNGKHFNIIKIQKNDEAKYSCLAKNDAGEDDATFDLRVLIPPTISGPSFRTIDNAVKKPTTLTCNISGFPIPDIEWILDGKPLPLHSGYEIINDGKTLYIPETEIIHRGRYTCKGYNKIGNIESDYLLQVTEPPIIKPMLKEQKVIEGQGITIRCEVEGSKVSKVEWRKNGEPYSSEFAHSSSFMHYIYIKETKLASSGNYTCIAYNFAGFANDTTKLTVLVPPSIIEGEKIIQLKENQNISLDCTATGIPTPIVTWKKGDTQLDVVGEKLNLINVSINDNGRYTCEASSESGIAVADFIVDVMEKPRIRDSPSDIRVKDGNIAKFECKSDGSPTPTVTWLRGGRPIQDKSGLLFSPRGETMMIPHAKKGDSGGYSCIAKNSGGKTEKEFTLTILTAPTIEESIDQNPRVIHGNNLVISCPVVGNPRPLITWLKDGDEISFDNNKYTLINETSLQIFNVDNDDRGQFTCRADNEVASIDTDYSVEIIDKPKFGSKGRTSYDVIINNDVTITCPVDVPQSEFSFFGFRTKNTLKIIWTKNGEIINNERGKFHISSDNLKLTIHNAELSSAGKYSCEVSNEAGDAEIDINLKVLIPPKIDKSNLIQNPLAILNKTISLECPVSGIPQPTVTWLRDGINIDFDSEKYFDDGNGQILNIKKVDTNDQGKYTCLVESPAGKTSEDFDLQVLIPPHMETYETQHINKREGEVLTLVCPVKVPIEQNVPVEIVWYKNNIPLDPLSSNHFKLLSDGRRYQVLVSSFADSANYTCQAMNRAGEARANFDVNILCMSLKTKFCRDLELKDIVEYTNNFYENHEPFKTKPIIDTTKIDLEPHFFENSDVELWCPSSGNPPPTIVWYKNGVEVDVTKDPRIKISPDKSTITISKVNASEAGAWVCLAENDAGSSELEIMLDIWVKPTAEIYSETGVTRKIGSSISLHCNVTGNPEPEIVWKFNGNTISSSVEGIRLSLKNTRLDIPRLSHDNVGEYSCHASNSVGSAEKDIWVDVLVPPLIDRDIADPNPRIPTEKNLTLTCLVEGKPDPEIVWTLNGTAINPFDKKYSISEEGRYLQIFNLTLLDSGNYKCDAINEAGHDEFVYAVDVDQAPFIYNSGTVKVEEGKVSILECKAVGEPMPKITWQRNGVRVESGERYIVNDGILKIIDTRLTDIGIYICFAENEGGQDQQAFTLEILVKPSIRESSPNETIVAAGTSFELYCMPNGYPQPQITWFLNDENIELLNKDTNFDYTVDDGILNIKHLSLSGNHIFKCLATNNAGEDSKELAVRVLLPPTLVSDDKKVLNITEGEPALLTCDIHESYRDDIVWMKNDESIQFGDNIFLSDDNSFIQIDKTKLSDTGNYTCLASNAAGQTHQQIQLNIGIPPKISEKERLITFKVGERGEIWCEATGVPNPQITWLKDDEPLLHTAVDKVSGEIKSSAIFESITKDSEGTYTCKAENWAGTIYKDFDLAVLIPPTIYPEKLNISTRPGNVVLLECNATGNPMPVVSWVKLPGVNITGSEGKYKLVGSTLAINNISYEDDGFYHCSAKSDAGFAIGVRKISVLGGDKTTKLVHVECDDNGNPVSKHFVNNRGDAPENSDLIEMNIEHSQLPQNNTEGIIIRCLPGRFNRNPLFKYASVTFTETPEHKNVTIGGNLELKCSAEGMPTPEIRWMKNGKIIDNISTELGSSTLKIGIKNINQSGTYTCIASNSISTQRFNAIVTVVDLHKENKIDDKLTNEITRIECALPIWKRDTNSIVGTGNVVWKMDNLLVDQNVNGIHLMNNNSLVVGYKAEKEELVKYIDCFVNGNHGTLKPSYVKIPKEKAPKVIIRPTRIHAKPTFNITIDCRLKRGNPLTTKVRWSKNDIPIISGDGKYKILGNNSLAVYNIESNDAGNYKCRAFNAVGKSWDGVKLIVEHGPTSASSKVTSESLILKHDIEYGEEEVDIITVVEDLIGNKSSLGKNLAGIMTAPYPLLSDGKVMPNLRTTKGKFNRTTEYYFNDGGKVVVNQQGKGMDENDVLDMNTDFGGDIPYSVYENIDLNPMDVEMYEVEPGVLIGTGQSMITLNDKHKIGFEWRDEIKYDADYEERTNFNDPQTTYITATPTIGPLKNKINTKFETRNDCPRGYYYIHGQCKDINECLTTDPCEDPEAECINYEGSYECKVTCAEGYVRKLDGTCVDIDECAKGPDVCPGNKECINLEGSYKCVDSCQSGYELNENDNCVDINECLLDICDPAMSCLNTPGSYICTCPEGFPPVNDKCSGLVFDTERPVYNIDFNNNLSISKCPSNYWWNGTICKDIDECSFDAPCQYKCTNLAGGYTCSCPEGYRLNEETLKCVDIDECVESPNPCIPGSFCVNIYGTFQCLPSPCRKGYTFKDNVCKPKCRGPCSVRPINVETISTHRGLSKNTPLLRLTTQDKDGNIMKNTDYHMSYHYKYRIENSNGRGIIYNNEPLNEEGIHRLIITSTPKDGNNNTIVNKIQQTILYVAISAYNF
uniref:protein-tyrosine-phosphatase n=1 Tax=Parastrongyloides trichosuri TaxID=131310 RepID=A0A0N4ZRH8_PARTI